MSRNVDSSDTEQQIASAFELVQDMKLAISMQCKITEKYKDSSIFDKRFTHLQQQVDSNKQIMENLKKEVMNMQDEIKQNKLAHNRSNAEACSFSIPTEIDKEETTLECKETSAINEEESSALQENHHKLTTDKSEHKSKTMEYIKETEYCINNEKETGTATTTAKVQKVSSQASREKGEKVTHDLSTHQKLVQEQYTEEQQAVLEQSQADNKKDELYIREIEDANKCLNVNLENANKMLLQANKNIKEFEDKNRLLECEKENLEFTMKRLQDETNALKAANEELEEYKKTFCQFEQKVNGQLQEIMLLVSAKMQQYCTLEESCQQEKMLEDLQNLLQQCQSAIENIKVEKIGMKLQDAGKPRELNQHLPYSEDVKSKNIQASLHVPVNSLLSKLACDTV